MNEWIPFLRYSQSVRLAIPASVVMGTLGISPFILAALLLLVPVVEPKFAATSAADRLLGTPEW